MNFHLSQAGLICGRAALVLGLKLALVLPLQSAEKEGFDPRKVLGAHLCGECHGPMMDVWKSSAHYRTFYTMHRRREAQRIASHLGIERIKSESRCAQCHYLSQNSGGQTTAVSGVSCESCHGPAADWNKAHSDLTDPNHLAKAEALGMKGPSTLYHIAARCYQCHTVPDETLVNQGGHGTGGDFELVANLQGEVRHNFVRSEGRKNEEASLPRRRVMFLLGQALELEYGLRALAEATGEGEFVQANVRRINRALERLKTIGQTAEIEEVKQILAAMNGAALRPQERAPLLERAERVSGSAQAFAKSHDGTMLGALDQLLPQSDDYVGTVYQP